MMISVCKSDVSRRNYKFKGIADLTMKQLIQVLINQQLSN